jgi:hypothetical protein
VEARVGATTAIDAVDPAAPTVTSAAEPRAEDVRTVVVRGDRPVAVPARAPADATMSAVATGATLPQRVTAGKARATVTTARADAATTARHDRSTRTPARTGPVAAAPDATRTPIAASGVTRTPRPARSSRRCPRR